MCSAHWRAYTAGLARDAKARKATAETPAGAVPAEAAPEPEPEPEAPAASPVKRRRAKTEAGEGKPG